MTVLRQSFARRALIACSVLRIAVLAGKGSDAKGTIRAKADAIDAIVDTGKVSNNGTLEEGAEHVVTDDGDEGGEEKQTTHNDHNDIFTNILKPEELQPLYLMPVAFGTKAILTFLIFGFEFSFKPPAPRTSLSPIMDLARNFASCSFICLACNGYYQDFQQISKVSSGFSTFVSVFFLLTVTSPNYVAARAVWGSLTTQSPAKILGLKPTYTQVPGIGIPIMPGVAKYLPFLKHIYALILVPYLLLPWVAQIFGCFMFLCTCNTTKCALACCCCKSACSFCCALLGVILTMGLWAWAKDSLAYWWFIDWPFCYYFLLQFWATSLAPIIFGAAYACALRASPENAYKALCQMQGLTFDEEDVEELRQLNYDKLKDDFDFEYEEVPPSEDGSTLTKAKLKAAKKILNLNPCVLEAHGLKCTKEELMDAFKIFDDTGNGYLSAASLRGIMRSLPGDKDSLDLEADEMIREADIEGGGQINYEEWIDRSLEYPVPPGEPAKPKSLDDAKIVIFVHTLRNMSSIVIEQLVVIWLVRSLNASSIEAYAGDLRTTISERSLDAYLGGLQEMASMKMSAVLNLIWNIL